MEFQNLVITLSKNIKREKKCVSHAEEGFELGSHGCGSKELSHWAGSVFMMEKGSGHI